MQIRGHAFRAAISRCHRGVLIALAGCMLSFIECRAEDSPTPIEMAPGELKPALILSLSDARQRVILTSPAANAALQPGESLHPSIQPEFRAAWDGFLKIETTGSYTFSGGGKLSLGGVAVGDKRLALKAGLYVFHHEWERTAGLARLQTNWASEHFESESIPSRVLFHSEKDPEFAIALAIERGRSLANELNCAACHTDLATGAAAESGILNRKAPDLSAVGSRTSERWIFKWLENPQGFQNYAAMPTLPLSADERRDIATYLVGMRLPATYQRKPLPGKALKLPPVEEIFESIGCRACHTPERNSIRGMGSKYTEESLFWFLLDPKSVHPDARMPSLFYVPQHEEAEVARQLAGDPDGKLDQVNPLRRRQNEARAIAKYLLQSQLPEFELEIPRGDPVRGEALLQSSGCLNCHTHRPPLDIRTKALGKKPPTSPIKQSAWQVLGPFDNGGRCETAFPPETAIEPAAAYPGTDGKSVRWSDGSAFADGKVHTLVENRPNATMYFYRTIDATEPVSGILYVGSDDTITVWLNGVKQHDFMMGRGMPENKDEVSVTLQKGRNTLLIKVGNVAGDYQFYYQAGEFSPAMTSSLIAPPLTAADARGCLAETPAGRTPRFAFKNTDRADLVAFCAARSKSPDVSPAPSYTAQRQVQQFGCVNCHEWHGRRPVAEVTDAPPPLTAVGQKLRPAWLSEVISKRRRVRPWMGLRMPHFGDDTLPNLTHGLQALDGATTEIAAETPASREEIIAGIALIGKSDKGLGCIVCHDFRGQKSLGVRGPDMTGMAERLRPDWFRHWMLEPNRIQPGTKMPQYFADQPAAETGKRLHLLWSALALGPGMPQPAGLPEQQRNLLAVRDKPQILRAQLPDSSPRSIAVGLPGLISYCFDAERCAVRYAWFGEFLDVTLVRSGMGSGQAAPLGQRFFTAPDQPPLGIGTPRAQTIRFRGYRLIEGRPEFQFELDGKSVTQQIERLTEGRGLRYSFKIAAGGKPVFFSAGPEKDVSIDYRASAGTWNGATLQIPAAESIEFSLEVRAK